MSDLSIQVIKWKKFKQMTTVKWMLIEGGLALERAECQLVRAGRN